MLELDVCPQDLMDLQASSVGDYCETMLDAARLRDELLGDGPFGRKSFCAYLGIGESTLTGWFKEDRIPRVAAEAYVLFLALQVMREEVRHFREEADDLKVVETNGKYAVCRFGTGDDHGVLGEVIAENIADLGTARALASGMSGSTLKLLKESDSVIDLALERTEDNPSYEAHLQELSGQISDRVLLATDYDAWKQKRKPLTLDDFVS